MTNRHFAIVVLKLSILPFVTLAFCSLLISDALAASIELTVLDDFGPVSAGDAEGALFVESSLTFQDPPGNIETDADGKLTFSGLGTNTYFVRVKHVRSMPILTKFKHHIVVGPGENVQETVSFRSGGDLKIRVRSEAGSVPDADIDAPQAWQI